MKPTNDPTIDRIREVRHQISAEFGHDPNKLIAFYASLEKELSGRFTEDRDAGRGPALAASSQSS
jgi:hypothetical protein